MKVLAGIFFIFSFLSSLGQGVNKNNNKNYNKMKIPIVTKEYERIDSQYFNWVKNFESKTLDDGTYIEYQKQSYGFIERIIPKDSYFKIIKQYYHNGNIRQKGVIFISGSFKNAMWYYYDEQGSLTREEDNNKDFPFTFEKLFEYLQKEKISLTKGEIQPYSGFHTDIDKRVNGNEAFWVVRWLKGPTLIEERIIDGKTGNVVKKNDIHRPES
jgi:hypothetical protein